MIARSFPVQLVSWEESANLSRILAHLLKVQEKREPDLVIAIGRGGLVPARVVCDELLFPSLSCIQLEHWGPAASLKKQVRVTYPLACSAEGKEVLLIDDVTDTGETLSAAVSYLEEFSPARIRTGVLHHKKSSSFVPDYYAQMVAEWFWIIYPWAFHEDLCGFLELELGEQPLSLEKLRETLLSRYGIPVTLKELISAATDLCWRNRAEKIDEEYRKPSQINKEWSS